MVKLKIFMVLLVGILPSIDAQNIDGLCSDVSLLGNPLDNNQLEYQKYNPMLQLKNRYSSFVEVKNRTPEELMISQMSVLNNDWLSYNFETDIKWNKQQFDRIRNQNGQHNYLELIRKVSYTFGNVKYAILRVNVIDERRDKPTLVSLMAKYKGNKWVLINSKLTSSIEFFLMNLNLKYLDALFENIDSDNPVFNNIIRSSWEGEIFKLTRAYFEFGNSMLDNDTLLTNIYERSNSSKDGSEFQEYQPNYSFESKVIKTNYLIPYSNQSYCYYFANTLSEFKEAKLSNLLNYIEVTNISNEGKRPKVFPIHKYEYDTRGIKLIIIKYRIKRENSNEEYLTSAFKFADEEVKEFKELDDTDKLIQFVISISKPEIIVEFSNKENNPKYPEINKLKPLVKDANGVLNIEKLAQVIEENKASLSKYLDE